VIYDPREGPSVESQKFTSSMMYKRGETSIRMKDESSVITSREGGGGTQNMIGSSIETREGGAVQESSSEDDEDNIERESMKNSRKE
jgi:hypothetical protein